MSVSNQFEKVIAKMPVLFNALRRSSLLSRDNLGALPKRGVYVFYENDVPLYVGRSNRLRRRLIEHSRPSSLHNSATFAFILAVEEAEKQGIDCRSQKRDVLQVEPAFEDIYSRAKTRVSDMKIKITEVNDPIEQTVFEVYVALKLNTPYNSFENH